MVLTPTDWLNIICFVIVTIIAIICTFIAIKKKLPCWKFQVGWVAFMEFLGILLLVCRLT